jgi:hypothetical protein
MTLSPSRVSLALACVVSAVLVLSSSAVAQEPSLEPAPETTHAGAPLDDGKGKGKPPYVPSTGPMELAAIAVVGAGYLTYRRVRKS